MKRMGIFIISAVMLLSVLTGCSATGYVDDGRGYSNVSTTDNGRVNGTNPSMTGIDGAMNNGTNGSGRTTTGTNGSRGSTNYNGASAGINFGTTGM